MRSGKTKRIILLSLTVVTAALAYGFLAGGQESKDFKLTKNLDIYISLFRELNAFYVDEIDPEKLVTRSICLLYTSPSPRDRQKSRMPSSA